MYTDIKLLQAKTHRQHIVNSIPIRYSKPREMHVNQPHLNHRTAAHGLTDTHAFGPLRPYILETVLLFN